MRLGALAPKERKKGRKKKGLPVYPSVRNQVSADSARLTTPDTTYKQNM
jgi:hypothetical protein